MGNLVRTLIQMPFDRAWQGTAKHVNDKTISALQMKAAGEKGTEQVSPESPLSANLFKKFLEKIISEALMNMIKRLTLAAKLFAKETKMRSFK